MEIKHQLLQSAFDCLASLVEESAVTGWHSPVLEAAEALCDELRDAGIQRKLYASDYYLPGLPDERSFQTENAATAFALGLEVANDGSIHGLQVRQKAGLWVVNWIKED